MDNNTRQKFEIIDPTLKFQLFAGYSGMRDDAKHLASCLNKLSLSENHEEYTKQLCKYNDIINQQLEETKEISILKSFFESMLPDNFDGDIDFTCIDKDSLVHDLNERFKKIMNKLTIEPDYKEKEGNNSEEYAILKQTNQDLQQLLAKKDEELKTTRELLNKKENECEALESQIKQIYENYHVEYDAIPGYPYNDYYEEM